MWTLGPTSGAHSNPAVTGVALARPKPRAGLLRPEKRGRWVHFSVIPEASTARRSADRPRCGVGSIGLSPGQSQRAISTERLVRSSVASGSTMPRLARW